MGIITRAPTSLHVIRGGLNKCQPLASIHMWICIYTWMSHICNKYINKRQGSGRSYDWCWGKPQLALSRCVAEQAHESLLYTIHTRKAHRALGKSPQEEAAGSQAWPLTPLMAGCFLSPQRHPCPEMPCTHYSFKRLMNKSLQIKQLSKCFGYPAWNQ